MLRNVRARWLAVLTAAIVIVLAAVFAWLRNLPGERDSSPAVADAVIDQTRLDAGRAAFERLGCPMCHSIAGSGNPASPLDGIGSRHDAAAIRDWVLGEGTARERLSGGVVRLKARAAEDPDLDALVAYLARSK
jgi:hypothetical protein